jgi:hypothetical protein
MKRQKPQKPVCAGLAVLCLAVLGISGCASVDTVDHDLERQRVAFNHCHAMAAEKSEHAVTGASPALYHSAANSMKDCLMEIEHTPVIVHSDKAIRASAMTIINYIKAGELSDASDRLGTFRSTYSHQDLYLADGSSFIDNVKMLLGEVPNGAAEHGSLVNASPTLKSEIRRIDYWQSH